MKRLMGVMICTVSLFAAEKQNPFSGDPVAARAGAKLYAHECSACHGKDREGRGNAPALDQKTVGPLAPGELFRILRNGSLRRGMPSFAHLPEPQRWQVITFLKDGGR